MSMKTSNDTIGNRTCDLQACSAVPQPTAPPAACPRHRHRTVFKTSHGSSVTMRGTAMPRALLCVGLPCLERYYASDCHGSSVTMRRTAMPRALLCVGLPCLERYYAWDSHGSSVTMRGTAMARALLCVGQPWLERYYAWDSHDPCH